MPKKLLRSLVQLCHSDRRIVSVILVLMMLKKPKAKVFKTKGRKKLN